MRDPVERMVKFVRAQKQQAAAEHARMAWSQRLPTLVGCVEEVVEVFRSGLEESSQTPLVSMLVDPEDDLRPLVILFQGRDGQDEGILRLHSAPVVPETGASAVFRCGEDGIVRGFRYPFHKVGRDMRPEQFVDLGEPSTIQASKLGHAVADFLEWASVGEGRGRRKMRFWSPPAPAASSQPPIRLAIVSPERAAA